MTEAIARSWSWLDAAVAAVFNRPLARRLTRNNRLLIPLCILLICGSFAAAALLQMRNDPHHALAAAAQAGSVRAQDLAAVTAMSLDRFAAVGEAFAANPGAAPTPYVPLGIRNIENHAVTATLSSSMLGGELWFTAYGGYINDRYSNDGLLAGLELHYMPAPGVDLALGVRHSNVSWVQGQTGKQTTAGLNLTLGMGAPPQPSWLSNQL